MFRRPETGKDEEGEGEPVPDAVRALWKDELCAVLELGPLAREDVEALVEASETG